MEPNNRDYTNGEITVHLRPDECIHVTTCYRELIEVFNPGSRPWVNMKGAPTERINGKKLPGLPCSLHG